MKEKNYYRDDSWNEEDWERFLKKVDVRAAKYLELFETLHDHPECDNIIAEEMGWNQKYEDCGYGNDSCGNCEKSNECYIYEINQMFGKSVDFDELTGRDTDDVKKITAYKRSYELYIRLNKYFENNSEKDAAEDVSEAISASAMVSAKIAGGHGMGYEKDLLCGNIANCKRSLRSAKACIESLEMVRAKSIFPESDIDNLICEAIKVESEVIKWIEYLRSIIW